MKFLEYEHSRSLSRFQGPPKLGKVGVILLKLLNCQDLCLNGSLPTGWKLFPVLIYGQGEAVPQKVILVPFNTDIKVLQFHVVNMLKSSKNCL